MHLGLDTTEQGEWTVLRVSGEIDVATAPKLREKIISLVGEGCLSIVVDLAAVDFLDSTGLGVLVGALKRVREHDGELRIACDEPRIVKVFEITGLTDVFGLHGTVDDAVS